MKATFSDLWDTGTEILVWDGSEFERPTSIKELSKAENVVIGEKIEGTRLYNVLIDDTLKVVIPRKVCHPSGGGSMLILEVY